MGSIQKWVHATEACCIG